MTTTSTPPLNDWVSFSTPPSPPGEVCASGVDVPRQACQGGYGGTSARHRKSVLLTTAAIIVLVTAVVGAACVRWRASVPAPLGWMSEQWVAQHRTSYRPN